MDNIVRMAFMISPPDLVLGGCYRVLIERPLLYVALRSSQG